MRWWREERQWVSDDGLRCYFSERDPGGPSRLECYRRLLAEPVETRWGGHSRAHVLRASWSNRAFENVLAFVQGGWRRLAAVGPGHGW
jgi:hypothetical protein